ncbi:MAG: 7,8-didemethyl-8-hydroxy-5-deazariboflavin synthase CofG [Deltaproteobacteria bacterium]|nr:7,8-didemethyl-8-hydroxy-5-deazariboflavin synthase CofG [Deltaproteobacteria bacterium]
MSSRPPILEHASREPVSDEGAYRLSGLATGALCEAARTRRDRVWGKTLTFSPKVFLPITNLCRNQCDYCSFRRSPGDPGEWTMSPGEIRAWLQRARVQGCIEALFCLGDTPETGFRDYRTLLRSWGHERTVDYLRWAAEEALAAGLLPHTNAGILSRADMIALRPVNVSLGLMLENVSDRLCEKGMPHHRAPDKRPAKRMQMTREAGELRIPFTSGLLIGIGETVEERVDTILTIRRLHREYGHIGSPPRSRWPGSSSTTTSVSRRLRTSTRRRPRRSSNPASTTSAAFPRSARTTSIRSIPGRISIAFGRPVTPKAFDSKRDSRYTPLTSMRRVLSTRRCAPESTSFRRSLLRHDDRTRNLSTRSIARRPRDPGAKPRRR